MNPHKGVWATGAESIVWTLEALGVTTIFGIPGGNVIPLYDALFDSRTIRHILARHEQGAGHAAEGFATAAGEIGVAIATSGPGATNLVTPIAHAYFNSVPLLLITGQVMSSLRGTDAFQQGDIVGITMPIVKHSLLVERVDEIPNALVDAHGIATSGRPGPVLVDITKDAQQARAQYVLPELGAPDRLKPAALSAGQVDAAVARIGCAVRPVIYAGRGVVSSGAGADLCRLVNYTGIPVVTTPAAAGAFPAKHHLNLGVAAGRDTSAANEALRSADLVVAIGAGIDRRRMTEEGRIAESVEIIQVNIDPTEMPVSKPSSVSILGDAGEAISALLAAAVAVGIEGRSAVWSGRREVAVQSRKAVNRIDPRDERLCGERVVGRIVELSGANAIVATGWGHGFSTITSDLSRQHLGHLLDAAPASVMGYAIAAAMGAKLATPERVVWAIESNRSFQMGNQELATCIMNGVAIKVAVLNPTSRDDRGVPDVVKLAESYGALAVRVHSVTELEDAVKLSMATNDRCVVIDIVLSENSSCGSLGESHSSQRNNYPAIGSPGRAN